MKLISPESFQKYSTIFFRDITAMGGAALYFVLILAALTFQQYHISLKLFLGFIFTGIISNFTRTLYFKNRPTKQQYHNLIERLDASSFPSWHTARIVFISLILGFYFNTFLTTLFFTSLALLVAYSRIVLKKHDWWDLFGGFFLGIVTYWLSLFI